MKTMHRVRPRRGVQRNLTPSASPRAEPVGMRRRTFMKSVMLGGSALALACRQDPPPPTTPPTPTPPPGVYIPSVNEGESLFGYLERTRGGFDPTLYRQLIGAANEYKEGDEAARPRRRGRHLPRQRASPPVATRAIGDLRAHPLFEDGLFTLIEQGVDSAAARHREGLDDGRAQGASCSTGARRSIKALMAGLSSDVIGCVVKLMSNAELIAVGRKVFNPLPGSKIGAKGYLGARIQPNSPTDHPDDIRWQVFNGWAFAVGDVVLGTNPVSSESPESVAAVENALHGHARDVRPRGRHAPLRAVPHRRAGRGGAACSPAPPALVPEPRRHRGRQPDLRRHHREDAGPRGRRAPASTASTSRRARAPTAPTATAMASTWWCTSRASTASRARSRSAWPQAQLGAGRRRRPLGAPQRRGRLHRPRGVPHPRAARALLPRGHRHGQAARADHRPGRLLHAAHGRVAGRPGLVPGADHAGQPRPTSWRCPPRTTRCSAT